VESEEKDDRVEGRIFGLLDHDIPTLSEIFLNPRRWEDIVTLHINVKCFTIQEADGTPEVTLYLGRKFYQTPEQAFKLVLDYRIEKIEKGHLKISLNGRKGPMGTHDYEIRLEAIPVGGGQSFIRFVYSYGFGTMAKIGASAYLETLGQKKIGFSVLGTDGGGNPVYVQGMRGIVERNAMRYYLAIQAYLDTLSIPEECRSEKRFNRWFDLTDRYPAQLHEMEREYYLACKKREAANRVILQNHIDADRSPLSVTNK
jgi:hypothetical protein